jgi:hypothetical protein
MKKTILIIPLVLVYLNINAQEYSKFNLGFNLSTTFSRTLLLAPSLNYDLGKRVEIGLIPIYNFQESSYSRDYTWKQYTWGANLSGKYYLVRKKKMDPYASLILGMGKMDIESNFGAPQSSRNSYLNFGALLGTEINIGNKGWNLDFNVGLLWNKRDFDVKFYSSPFYSIGFKKRFLKNGVQVDARIN